MAAHDLTIPQITAVDTQKDNDSSPLDNSSFPTSGPPMCHSISPLDTHDFLSHPTLVLTNRRTHPDVPSSPASRTSNASSTHPTPSPAHCGHAGSRENNPSVLKGDNAGLRLDSAELGRSVEADSNVDHFAFKQLELVALVDAKSLDNLEGFGGVEGLLHGLGTNRCPGLNFTQRSDSPDPDPGIPGISAVTTFGMKLTPMPTFGGSFGVGSSASLKISVPHEATIEDRQRVYGHNIPPPRPGKRILHFMWLALYDKVFVFLSIAAIASLALGVFLSFSSTRSEGELPADWVEGIAIVLVILIAVIVGSLNNWQKERQFVALNEKREDRLVKVIRDGGERLILISQLVVGDVVLLEPGDVIPCDGVFLSGHNVLCDESGATGESDAIKKLSYQECIALRDKKLDADGPSGVGGASPSDLEFLGHADCFIVSGSKVLEGVGSYVVTSVGTKSFNGRIMTAFSDDSVYELESAWVRIARQRGGLL